MTQRTDTYDVELLMVIDERDAFEAWADRLANAIGEHLGIDIGEHTSSNIPWYNALEAIQGAPKPPASAQSVEPVGEALNFDNEHVKGMTGCLFAASEVPVGTKLYTTPPPSAGDVRDAALEEAAKLADEMGIDYFARYKGRPPYSPDCEGRANPYYEGMSDGAEHAAEAIRALKSKKGA